jgi:DNA-binding XRE family transcriptional regulator
MIRKAQEVKVGRQTFYLLRKSDYLRLVQDAESTNVNAVDYARESIGRDLRRKRQKAGLTQTEVARRAEIRLETLSRLENGHGNPTLATVKRILLAIGEKV